ARTVKSFSSAALAPVVATNSAAVMATTRIMFRPPCLRDTECRNRAARQLTNRSLLQRSDSIAACSSMSPPPPIATHFCAGQRTTRWAICGPGAMQIYVLQSRVNRGIQRGTRAQKTSFDRDEASRRSGHVGCGSEAEAKSRYRHLPRWALQVDDIARCVI